MRHVSNSTASAPSSINNYGDFQHWNSPIPYLFGGLALMLGLIAMALMVLACSFKKSSPPSINDSLPRDHHQTTHEDQKAQNEFQMEMEPKIVVIMAGDDNPTYLAKPAAAASA